MFLEKGTRQARGGAGKGRAVGHRGDRSGWCRLRLAQVGKARNTLLRGQVFLAAQVIRVNAGLILGRWWQCSNTNRDS